MKITLTPLTMPPQKIDPESRVCYEKYMFLFAILFTIIIVIIIKIQIIINIIIINTTVVNKIMIIIIIITIIKSLAAFLDPRKSSKHPFESLLHYVIPYGVLQLHHCSELFPKNIFGNLRFVPSSVCKA